MSWAKIGLDRLLRHLTIGGLTITWWDGTTQSYGPSTPTVHLTIKDPAVANRIVRNPSLGFGEGYMDGLIDIESDLHDVVALANLNAQSFARFRKPTLLRLMRGVTISASTDQSRRDIAQHYDLGNDFYELWLDETMSYSCAYFRKPTDSLKQAQIQKLDHVLRKLQLRKGQRLLDIGCGWGWLIIKAAKQYGVKAHGISHSKQQVAKVKQRIKQEGLSDLVTVELADYRNLTGSDVYDRIVSVGMFEHVGRPNHRQYMATVNRLLKNQGISLLHTITKPLESATDAWIAKYIFPGGYIPSWREVINLMPDYDFYLTDVESLRIQYALTLDHWAKNFEQHVDEIRTKRGESFVRMWRLYLRSCAASFRTAGLDLHQFVFTKGLNNDLPLTREFLYR